MQNPSAQTGGIAALLPAAETKTLTARGLILVFYSAPPQAGFFVHQRELLR